MYNPKQYKNIVQDNKTGVVITIDIKYNKLLYIQYLVYLKSSRRSYTYTGGRGNGRLGETLWLVNVGGTCSASLHVRCADYVLQSSEHKRNTRHMMCLSKSRGDNTESGGLIFCDKNRKSSNLSLQLIFDLLQNIS